MNNCNSKKIKIAFIDMEQRHNIDFIEKEKTLSVFLVLMK